MGKESRRVLLLGGLLGDLAALWDSTAGGGEQDYRRITALLGVFVNLSSGVDAQQRVLLDAPLLVQLVAEVKSLMPALLLA